MLTDVIRSLLTPEFLVDIFRPQSPLTFKSLRAMFCKIAHSSIMRLNEGSMSKLYDLMVMAFKYQTLACGHPSRVPLEVSFRHLSYLRDILTSSGSSHATAAAKAVKSSGSAEDAPSGTPTAPAAAAALEAALAATGSGTVADLIDAVGRSLQAVYGDLPAGEQWALYSTLLNFFLDKRIKVSALIAEGVQNADGSIRMGCAGPLPRGAGAVGSVKRFDPATGKVVGTEELPSLKAVHAQAAEDAGGGGGGIFYWRYLGGKF